MPKRRTGLPAKIGFWLLLPSMVFYLYLHPQHITAMHLAVLNEDAPSADAKCDMKRGLVGCYGINGSTPYFPLMQGDVVNNICSQYPMLFFATSSFSDDPNVRAIDERAKKYSTIYNAMVLASAPSYRKSYFEEIFDRPIFYYNRLVSLIMNQMEDPC